MLILHFPQRTTHLPHPNSVLYNVILRCSQARGKVQAPSPSQENLGLSCVSFQTRLAKVKAFLSALPAGPSY